MKKILALISIIFIIAFAIYYNRYTNVRTFDMDGYIFSSDAITSNLINGEEVSKKEVKFYNVKYDDTLYLGRGKYYIGDKNKREVDLGYPLVSNNNNALLLLSSEGKLVDTSYRKTSIYKNIFVSDSMLYNENDYERADNLYYLFVELNNSIFVNLNEIQVNTTVLNKIPINSFILFNEDRIRFYYLKNKKYIYQEITSIDLDTKVTFFDKTITYGGLLERLGLLHQEETVEEEDDRDEELPPIIVEKEEIVVEENDSVTDVSYVKPNIFFDSVNSKVYSMSGRLEIVDPTHQIVKYPTFEFYKDKKLFFRKTFVSSDTIDIKGLYPDSDYEVVGIFHYKNEKGQEVKSEFTRFNITTKDISGLETLNLTIKDIIPYVNYAEMNGITLNNKSTDEVLKGLKKINVKIGNNDYQLGSILVNSLSRLQTVDYVTGKVLTSNTYYDVHLEAYDLQGNLLKLNGADYSFKTPKQAPFGSLAVVSRNINKATLRFDISNKDNINIENMHYTVYDSSKKLVYDEKTSSDTISLDNLEANEVYTVSLFGDYDLENGEGIKKNQLILDGKFTTEPISTLGYVRLNFSEIESGIDYVKYNISISPETNPRLISLLKRFNIKLKDNNNNIIKNIDISDEDFSKLINGESITKITDELQSNHTYYFDIISHVFLGSKDYEIKTLTNISDVKTLRKDANVEISNRFITESIIDFDVRVRDDDGAIQSNRVLMEVRDSKDVLIYYNELNINDDYVHVSLSKLNIHEYYTFKYIAEEYNIGHDNTTFQGDVLLFSEKILTEEGLFGTLSIDSLLKQITSKNIFDIKNSRRWKTVGERDVERRKINLTENTISLGAKNGKRTYSYYLPEYKDQQVTVSFDIKYESNDHMKPIYICPNASNYCTSYKINNVNANGYIHYTKTFTISNTSPYVSFTIEEDSGENNITTIVLRNFQIELGNKPTSYVMYTEKNKYMGTFISNLSDRNHEIKKDDFHYFLRFYRNGQLEKIITRDMNDNYQVINEIQNYEISPSSNYQVKLSVRKKITLSDFNDQDADIIDGYRYYDLDVLDFTSDDEIRTIRTIDEFYAIHISGFYLVDADLDFSNETRYISTIFNGIIDFQGHKVIRDTSRNGLSSNSFKWLFERIGSNGILRNIDVHYYFDGNAISDYWGFARYHYGTIENIMVTLEQDNKQPNVSISLIVGSNYGIINNFVVNLKESLSIERNGSLIANNNYGTIKNGYLYGKNIDATYPNGTRDTTKADKAIGVITKNASSNSFLSNVYSLIGIDITEEQKLLPTEREVGNIFGPSSRSIVRNVYTYSEGQNRNNNYDLNIYSGTMNISNLYYVTANDYNGSYSNKLAPNALRMESFQNMLNADGSFDVDNYVKYGYFPHIIWPDVMPNQEYIALPNEDDGKIDYLSMENREELDNEQVEATLIFQNIGLDDIVELTFSNNLNADIIGQENKSGKSYVRVRFYNPSTYITKYSLTRIRHRNSAGFAGQDVTYGALERVVEVDMYKNIHNISEFVNINNNLAQNFKLQEDLDFTNVSFSAGTLTGKLDGNGHTIYNIRNLDVNFIKQLKGGTIKNLIIDSYVNSGNGTSGVGSYGGFIGQADTSANIDNVHIRHVSITERNTYIGALVGRTDGALISNCSVVDFKLIENDSTNVRYNGRYGGLVGENNNTIIQNSYVRDLNFTVYYASSTYGIGGLVGRHASGYIQDSYAQGIIKTNQQEVGGIAGYNSGYIERVFDAVDVYSQQDSVGGVVGYSTNDNIYNTLVVGGVYTAKDAININRTVGNRTAVNSNYAWENQLINGLNANIANGDIILTTEELKSITTYDSIIKFGNQFDLSKLFNDKGNNVLPKVKYLSSDELLPDQEDIEYYVDTFRVRETNIERSYDTATIQIFIDNPDEYEVKELKIDGLNIIRVNNNITVNGETLYEVYVKPEKYYDSYLISEITYMKNENEVKIRPSTKIDLVFYKDIGTFEDWQKIESSVYENYRLVQDIDFTGKSNVKMGVSVNRLEGTDGGHTLSGINFSASKGNIGFIETVASNISNITFDNIKISGTSSSSAISEYTGVIRFLNGTMYDVHFSNIELSSKRNYTACVGFNQSPDVKRVYLDTVTVSGTGYVAGLFANSRYFDVAHVEGHHLTITGTSDYVGGLIANRPSSTYSTMFNFIVDDVTVQGRDYVGGIFGSGAGDYMQGTNINVTGRSYIGGLYGRHYVTYTYYHYAKDVVIQQNGSYSRVSDAGGYVGGIAGSSYQLNYAYIDNVTINASREANNTYIGGIRGYGNYGVIYSGIRNSTIISNGEYTGGISGRSSNCSIQHSYVYNTTVKGRTKVGGILGGHNSNTTSVYYNISNADVIATSDYAGGIVGYMDNQNTTSATNKMVIYRNILAGSTISSSGNYAGSISSNSEKEPYPNDFYDNFISADVTSSGGNMSQFFIGNDFSDCNYTSKLAYNNLDNRGIRVYEGSTYNGLSIASYAFPSNVKKYSAADLKIVATFKELIASNFNFNDVTKGVYPYLSYSVTWDGVPYVHPQKYDLPQGISIGSRGATPRDNYESFPDVNVYASDVDKINIEFSKIDNHVTFKVNKEEHLIDHLSYTYYYDFKEDFEILLSDGINEKRISIKADDIKEISSVYKDNYYFIENDKLISNTKVSLEDMSLSNYNYSALKLENKEVNNTPIHIYQNKVLLDSKNIYDVEKKKIISNSFVNLSLTDSVSLYEFQYGDNVISTYYNYSIINDKIVSKQVYVEDNSLEVVDSSLNNQKNYILVDSYNGNNHLLYLGNDGRLYSLKDDVSFPERFQNSSIKAIKTDIYHDSNIIMVLYENDDYVVFNYRNGRIIKQSTKNKDPFSYFKSYITSSSTGNLNKKKYQDSLKLIKKVEKKKPSIVLGDTNTKDSNIIDSYTTFYKPEKKKYEIYQINNESIENGSFEDIISQSSVSNEIEGNPILYNYYIGKEIHNKSVVNWFLIIILSIFSGIIISIILLRRNLYKNKV